MVESQSPGGVEIPKGMDTPGISSSTVLGVDVGGTWIWIGMVDQEGKVIENRRYIMDRASQSLTLKSIETALTHFLNLWSGPAPLAMGVGLVGHTRPTAGLWVRAMNLPINSPVPIRRLLREQTGLPIAIDNDVHASTLAEQRWGLGKGILNFIYLNIGTGLAAGIVCDGGLVRGAANYAGELGHMVVDPGGILCTCGQHGCLEPICSGGGILAQVRSGLREYPDSSLFRATRGGTLTASQVFQAAEAGDRLAARITGKAVQGLSIALTNLVNLVNPSAIFYGGGVVSDGWLMGKVSEFIFANCLVPARHALKGIWPSRFDPEQVGLVGAACLAWDYLEKRPR
jgi:glucokinase